MEGASPATRAPRKGRGAAAILLLFLFLSGALQAKVFWRWHAARHADHALDTAGGRAAYRADVHLNGGRGSLSVYSFDDDLHTVADRLYRTFKSDALRDVVGSLAMARIEDKGQVLSLIVLSTGPGSPTVVFKFEQSAAEAARSQTPPENPLPEVGPYPNAKTIFFARDDRARTGLAVAESQAAPETIEAHYHARLTADGWTRPLPSSSPEQVQIYQRDEALCIVFVARASGSNLTRITLLHKQLGIE